MSLEVDVRRRLGTLDLDVTLRAEPGSVVALLGANGAGKSTLLRLLSGLLAADDGRIALDGQVLDEPATRTFVRAERRPVSVVFQAYLLFPNLSALENVAFGLRARGVGRDDARRQAGALLERFGLADRADARPAQLSGGQAQRVALARALATRPRLLLLDEPLAALDAATREEVRADLRRHLAGFDGVRLLVTHDLVDAFALADRVVVLDRGTVVQEGTVDDVVAQPRTRYVAELAGVNLVRGTLTGGEIVTPGGLRVVAAGDGTHLPASGHALATFAPRSVALYREPPHGSPRNVWRVTVTDADRRAELVRVRLGGAATLVAEVTVGGWDELALAPGDEVWAAVKATEIMGYAAT